MGKMASIVTAGFVAASLYCPAHVTHAGGSMKLPQARPEATRKEERAQYRNFYRAAKAECGMLSGSDKEACKADAKARYEKAEADSKARLQQAKAQANK